jgi:hypothetical protein
MDVIQEDLSKSHTFIHTYLGIFIVDYEANTRRSFCIYIYAYVYLGIIEVL